MEVFTGRKSVFSNFYAHPFEWLGCTVPTSEHAFMMEKAHRFDREMVSEIAAAPTAEAAKKLGRKVRNYNDAVWSRERLAAMERVLMAKFADPDLRAKLLATGNKIIVEAKPRDTVWGAGVGKDKAADVDQWRGANLQGVALMEVRAQITGDPDHARIALEQRTRAFNALATRSVKTTPPAATESAAAPPSTPDAPTRPVCPTAPAGPAKRARFADACG